MIIFWDCIKCGKEMSWSVHIEDAHAEIDETGCACVLTDAETEIERESVLQEAVEQYRADLDAQEEAAIDRQFHYMRNERIPLW